MATNPIFNDVPAWPTPTAAPAPRDHNRPPPEETIPLEFREALLAEKPDFLVVLGNILGESSRAYAEDAATLARCGNVVRKLRDAASHIKATHKVVKEPYLVGGRLVDAESNALLEKVDEAKKRVEGVGNAYVAKRDAEARAERERVQAEQRAAAEAARRAEEEREQAEREADAAAARAASDEEREAAAARAAEAAAKAEEAMAAAALAPAVPDRPEPVRSDEGATVSGKQEWKSEVTDYTVAFVHVEDHPKVREAIDKAIAQLVKAGKRSLDGVRIWPVAKANFR